ncbi:AsmA family protein [Granulicella arctica]|uniref:AsmA family protein n=1 Tax=Granulicella arctica TaxID=940613 RepID=UPI0021E08391|nr:AsmA family protein [Granulicella arctica]
MARTTRFLVLTFGAILLLLVIAVFSIPIFLNTDSFRARIETTLSKSLGRKLTIAKLDLALWSGSLVASGVTVADDLAFSAQPFIRADTVKIGVQVFPLLLHKQVLIRSFAIDTPQIQLLRAKNGTWNYSSIGSAAGKSRQDEDTKQTFPDLTIGKIDVNHGRITVGSGLSSTTPSRTYEQVDLTVRDFAFNASFLFTVSAHLPSDGSIELNGNAGPVNQADASQTPFSGHLELKHIDPLAAGFVDASDGVSGLINALVLDATWSGQQLHVSKLVVDTPRLTILRSNASKAAKPAAESEGDSMLKSLSVDDAQVKNGSITLATAGQTGVPAVYQQLDAQITNLTPKSVSPFSLSGQLPNGGALSASGNAGPYNQQNAEATPLDARVKLSHFELETAGILPPDAGISGNADLDAHVKSNGQALNLTGNTQITNIRLAKDGQPSAKPVRVEFNIGENTEAKTGQIQQAVIHVGAAVINLTGTFQTSGPSTALNLKVNGNAIPVNEIEAFLPALGVRLPEGSRLQGGSVTTTLTVSGTSASPIISGPVRLDSTQLAGFNLGAKLQTLSTLTGGRITAVTGSGTNIRSLSMVVQEQGGGIRTDNIVLDVTGVGTATGAGTVSPPGALNYNVLLKLTGLSVGPGAASTAATPAAGQSGGAAGIAGALAGFVPGGAGGGASALGLGNIAGVAMRSGIPVAIGGTTSNPTFAPNLAKLASGAAANAAQGLIKGSGAAGKQNPARGNPLGNALGGLLGKH